MLKIAECFEAPITLFVEALEFIAMERLCGDYRVRDQLQGALKNGHDAQLHIHPQWLGASKGKNNWALDMGKWRIGDLSCNEAYNALSHGKKWLEAIAAQHGGYKCLAFRAGGWCIQPSESVIASLQKLGFAVDSTVAPGFRNTSPGEWYDFRGMPALPYWQTTGDVCREGPAGILEVPIVTGKIGCLRHLQAVQRSRIQEWGFAPGCKGSYQGADGLLGRLRGKASRLADLGRVMLDLSTMPVDVLIDVTGQWLSEHGQNAAALPLVAIAHSKNFTRESEAGLEEYLHWAQSVGLVFSTFGGWLETLNGDH